MSITLVNNAAANVVSLENVATTFKARFHVLFWGQEIGDVEVNEAESTTIASPSMKASFQAISMADTDVSTGQPIDIKAQNIGVAEGSGGTIEVLLGAGMGATVENMIMVKNQCSFPLTVNITPDDVGARQTIPNVPPDGQEGVSLLTMFMAYARVHGYPNEPAGSDGYDTPAVSFFNPNATLTVWPNSDKGESFHIVVS